jgi:lipopolysaccharide/colanic/teichoic acid biosynthesis glycosyltransferase
VKRLMDIVITLASAIIWGPLLLVLMLVVRWKLGSPIFFRQPRTGLNGVTFQMLKFRTMTDARDAKGELLPDADRLTPFGR